MNKPTIQHGRGQRRRGFSLVEVIVATAIAGGLLVAALSAVGGTASARRINSNNETAVRLSKELMDEILAMPFEDELKLGNFGLEAGEKDIRKDADDVDDYDGFAERPPTTPDGNAVTTQSGWERSVRVVYVLRTDVDEETTKDEGLKRIEVSTIYKGNVLSTLVAIRSRGWDALQENR